MNKENLKIMVKDIVFRTYKEENKDFQIKTLDDAVKIFKSLKEFEKYSNSKLNKNHKSSTEWQFCLDDLKDWFNIDFDSTKTKNQTYLLHQSNIINNLFLNKEFFNKEWKNYVK